MKMFAPIHRLKDILAPNIDPELPKNFTYESKTKLFTSSKDTSIPEFDPLVTTAWELQELLSENILTTVKIIETYLEQIEQHNRRGRELRALISVAPRHELLKIARQLDNERA